MTDRRNIYVFSLPQAATDAQSTGRISQHCYAIGRALRRFPLMQQDCYVLRSAGAGVEISLYQIAT